MLESFADWLTFSLLQLNPESHLGASVQFFFYDTIKIFLLLIVVTHLMGVVRYYLPIEKIRTFLTSRKWYGLDHFLASGFGAITPFCSCSSIPLFIGFLEAQIPLGVTFSFLITSPLINEIAVTLFIGMFGWKVTLLYIAAGLLIGSIGGWVLGKMNFEKDVDRFVEQACCGKKKNKKKEEIYKVVPRQAFRITRRIAPYVLIGIALAAGIHGYVPTGFFEGYLEGNGWWTVPLAVILAVPMYSNAAGVIPVVQSLVVKGVPLGTAIAFMMAVVGLSFPEALILKKVMKLRLLLSFFGIVTLGIIAIGYAFNVIL